MAMISLMCPACERHDVIVKDWRYSHTQDRNAPWSFCPLCKWKGYLRVGD